MGIKIKNPKDREEILSQLKEMEEDEIESLAILADFYDDFEPFVFYLAYCPQCGDSRYISGKKCLACDFPSYNEKDDDWGSLDYMPIDWGW